jgi:hypothetical protein
MPLRYDLCSGQERAGEQGAESHRPATCCESQLRRRLCAGPIVGICHRSPESFVHFRLPPPAACLHLLERLLFLVGTPHGSSVLTPLLSLAPMVCWRASMKFLSGPFRDLGTANGLGPQSCLRSTTAPTYTDHGSRTIVPIDSRRLVCLALSSHADILNGRTSSWRS